MIFPGGVGKTKPPMVFWTDRVILSLSLSLHRHFGRNTGDSGGGGDCLLRRASRKMYHGNISWEYIYIYIMELLEKKDKHIIKSLEAWFQSNSNLQHLQHYKFGHWVTTQKKITTTKDRVPAFEMDWTEHLLQDKLLCWPSLNLTANKQRERRMAVNYTWLKVCEFLELK